LAVFVAAADIAPLDCRTLVAADVTVADADTVADPRIILTPEDVTDADDDATIGSTSTPNALEPKLLTPYEYALASIIAIY
jgi:hypothetical protein